MWHAFCFLLLACSCLQFWITLQLWCHCGYQLVLSCISDATLGYSSCLSIAFWCCGLSYRLEALAMQLILAFRLLFMHLQLWLAAFQALHFSFLAIQLHVKFEACWKIVTTLHCYYFCNYLIINGKKRLWMIFDNANWIELKKCRLVTNGFKTWTSNGLWFLMVNGCGINLG